MRQLLLLFLLLQSMLLIPPSAAAASFGVTRTFRQQLGRQSSLTLKRRQLFTSWSSSSSSSDFSTRYTLHDSFSPSLVAKYDAFILDQFGVLHNGQEALPGALKLCHDLVHRGKQLVILSNTSAPAHKALDKLEQLGFQRQWFVGAVTSGEEAAKFIKRQYTASTVKALTFTWDARIPNNPRLTALPSEFMTLAGNLDYAASVDEADFLLLHGSQVWQRSENDCTSLDYIDTGGLETVDGILRQCWQRRLPMVCANPDFVVATPSGGVAYMPGGIAARYVELIAAQETASDDEPISIHMFGKPELKHFEACLKLLDLPAPRVAHVGDSLHHDVAGAAAANIDSVWITNTGIHHQELMQAQEGIDSNIDSNIELDETRLPSVPALERVMRDAGNIVPTHVVPAFLQ